MLGLGKLYQSPSGILANSRTLPDYAEAMVWLEAAAKAGSAAAIADLALAYYDGTGVQQNRGHGMTLFSAAAQMGDAAAVCGLGRCYLEGHAVKASLSAAVRCLKLAAAMGHHRAYLYLGQAWVMQNKEVDAVDAFRLAAFMGVPEAHWHIASMAEGGRGGPRDAEAALRHYKRASTLNVERPRGVTEHWRGVLSGQVTESGKPVRRPCNTVTGLCITDIYTRYIDVIVFAKLRATIVLMTSPLLPYLQRL
jgi:TPR repeat protein